MNNLKVGDRARVVKWPCCEAELGTEMLLTAIQDCRHIAGTHVMECHRCHVLTRVEGIAAQDHTKPEGLTYLVACPLEWLEKIDEQPELGEQDKTTHA